MNADKKNTEMPRARANATISLHCFSSAFICVHLRFHHSLFVHRHMRQPDRR
jgi:hypothetical protein